METPWPLVGRSRELELITALLADRSPDGCGVVLAGPPGVGTTRVATETLLIADRAGWSVLRARATSSATGIPLGTVAPLLPEACESVSEASASLADRVRDGRLLLAVDDAHLMDPLSAALVHRLAAAGRAFVLLTIQPGPAPDAVVRLWKDGVLPRLDLVPLDRDGIAELLRAALGARLDRAAAAHLISRAGGDLGYLRELVRASLEAGNLRRVGDGPWTLAGGAPVSARLRDRVDARLGPLDAADRDLLEVVALADPAGPAELRAAAQPSRAEALERAGVLIGERDGRRTLVRVAHPLHAEMIRDRIPGLRAAALARRLAEEVEATGMRRADDVVRVAKWRLTGGGAVTAMLLRGAELARWRFDFPLAERLARAAFSDGGGFEAGLLVGQLAGLQGRVDEADTWLSELEDQASSDDHRGRLAAARLDNLTYELGRMADALAIADRAEATVRDPTRRDELAARRLALLLAIHGPAVAAEAGQELVDRAEGRALAWGCVELAYSWGRMGRLDDALKISERGYRVHQQLTEPFEWSPWMHRFLRCDNLAHAGELTSAEQLAAEERERGVDAGDLETQAFFALFLAKVVGDRGHVRVAAQYAEEALALFRKLGRRQMIRFGLTYLALARALAGQAEAAADVLEEIDDMGLPETYMTGVDLHQARGWATAASGDLVGARQLLRSAASVATRIGDHVGEAAALHGVARLGGPTSEPLARLRELTAVVDGQLVANRASHVAALDAGDPGAGVAAGDAFERMGADLLAAEAMSDAAVIFRRRGDLKRAAAASWRAQRLVASCGQPRTPALGSLSARSLLTPAQRDIAELAGAGRNNREIAEHLALSIRTVENHLQQVYRKLGLRRAELSAHLGANPDASDGGAHHVPLPGYQDRR